MKTLLKWTSLLLVPAIALAFLASAPEVGYALTPDNVSLLLPLAFGVGATLAVTDPTLLDLAKRTDPDGNISTIVEILAETNEVLDDMVWVEGNLTMGNRTTIRSGLPAPTWRKLYGTVQPTKSTTVQVTDSVGMLEAYARVDKALADLNSNTAAFRLSEDKAHIEGISQEIADTLFYGNEGTEPEAFTGLAPRFNLLSAENGGNIIDAGGTGSDNTSIWIVGWGERSVHGIIPKGSKAGLQVTDKGVTTIQESTGMYEAYLTHYRFDAGLTVRDWRYIVRIANIDISDLTKDAATGADLYDLVSQALELLPSLQSVRPVIYANRTIRSMLRRQQKFAVKSSTLSTDMVAGKPVMTIDGVPVRRTDAIHNAEARVV